MVRAAAKNHAHVAVVVDPADYAALLAELQRERRRASARRRASRLAQKAFAHTAAYDGAISELPDGASSATARRARFRGG